MSSELCFSFLPWCGVSFVVFRGISVVNLVFVASVVIIVLVFSGFWFFFAISNFEHTWDKGPSNTLRGHHCGGATNSWRTFQKIFQETNGHLAWNCLYFFHSCLSCSLTVFFAYAVNRGLHSVFAFAWNKSASKRTRGRASEQASGRSKEKFLERDAI